MQTSIRSRWQNGIAEQFVGSIRRELLDHVIPLNEFHLRRLGRDYLAYYHKDRTHVGLDKQTPSGRVVEPRGNEQAQIVAEPRVGGLHHRYTWSAAGPDTARQKPDGLPPLATSVQDTHTDLANPTAGIDKLSTERGEYWNGA